MSKFIELTECQFVNFDYQNNPKYEFKQRVVNITHIRQVIQMDGPSAIMNGSAYIDTGGNNFYTKESYDDLKQLLFQIGTEV